MKLLSRPAFHSPYIRARPSVFIHAEAADSFEPVEVVFAVIVESTLLASMLACF
jgi:hypothetical protein